MSSQLAIANVKKFRYIGAMTEATYIASLEAKIADSGMSKSEICRRAGIANSTLIRILNGERSPMLETVQRIERAICEGKPRPAA